MIRVTHPFKLYAKKTRKSGQLIEIRTDMSLLRYSITECQYRDRDRDPTVTFIMARAGGGEVGTLADPATA